MCARSAPSLTVGARPGPPSKLRRIPSLQTPNTCEGLCLAPDHGQAANGQRAGSACEVPCFTFPSCTEAMQFGRGREAQKLARTGGGCTFDPWTLRISPTLSSMSSLFCMSRLTLPFEVRNPMRATRDRAPAWPDEPMLTLQHSCSSTAHSRRRPGFCFGRLRQRCLICRTRSMSTAGESSTQ